MCAQFVPTKIKVGATPDVRFQYGLIMRPRAQQAGIDSHQVERENINGRLKTSTQKCKYV